MGKAILRKVHPCPKSPSNPNPVLTTMLNSWSSIFGAASFLSWWCMISSTSYLLHPGKNLPLTSQRTKRVVIWVVCKARLSRLGTEFSVRLPAKRFWLTEKNFFLPSSFSLLIDLSAFWSYPLKSILLWLPESFVWITKCDCTTPRLKTFPVTGRWSPSPLHKRGTVWFLPASLTPSPHALPWSLQQGLQQSCAHAVSFLCVSACGARKPFSLLTWLMHPCNHSSWVISSRKHSCRSPRALQRSPGLPPTRVCPHPYCIPGTLGSAYVHQRDPQRWKFCGLAVSFPQGAPWRLSKRINFLNLSCARVNESRFLMANVN